MILSPDEPSYQSRSDAFKLNMAERPHRLSWPDLVAILLNHNWSWLYFRINRLNPQFDFVALHSVE